MSKPKTKAKARNKAADQPNNSPAFTLAQCTTQAECYKQAWSVLLNKLSKGEQETLTQRLAQPPEIIRGREVVDPQVSKFIKAVAELGESYYALKGKNNKAAKAP